MCSNTNTETVVNKLLGFIGKKPDKQVGISKPKAAEDKKLMDSFLSCVEKYSDKPAIPRDETKVSVARADITAIRQAKRELAALLNDMMENRDKFLDTGFYQPHVKRALSKIDNALNNL